MGKTTLTGEDPNAGSAAEIILALDKLAHERRLATIVEVGKGLGVHRVETDTQRRMLSDAMRGFEGVLLQMQLDDDQEPLRRAYVDANPDFTPDEIEQLVRERLGGQR